MSEAMDRAHDPDLPAWGPYGKLYAGAAHVPGFASGLLWNYSFMPTLFRRRAEAAALRWESGHHPWEAAPDYSYWKYRHELIWKDELFCDVEYCAAEDGGVLVRAEFVNNTPVPQNVALHHIAFLSRPGRRPKEDAPLVPCEVRGTGGARWLPALGYRELSFPHRRERDGLELAAAIKGEVPVDGFVSGFGLAEFAEAAGSVAVYDCGEISGSMRLLVRAWVPVDGRVRLAFEGGLHGGVEIEGAGEIQVVEAGIQPGDGSGEIRVRCVQGCEGARLDGFALLPPGGDVAFESVDWDAEPSATTAGRRGLVLHYAQAGTAYGLVWLGDEAFCRRELITGNLDHLLKITAHDHVSSRIEIGRGHHFTDIFVRPIVLRPGERKVLRAAMQTGTREAMEAWAMDWQQRGSGAFDAACSLVRPRAFRPTSLLEGEKHVESQTRMAATTLTNVVYPTRIKGSWNRHFSPGKWWDSPYTWDSGMLAVGLAAIEPRRALECIRAYLTEPGDADAAFVHWGSPVPTQFYAFHEVWNHAGAPAEMARSFFPGLRHYHRFLVGRHPHSRTLMPSGLIRTFDYFYNSGGWDDYPPQVFVHDNNLASRVAPAGNAAHSIRTAKILKQLAAVLGEDTGEFDDDIANLTGALNEHAWDAEAGTFSYVLHDATGQPEGFLREPESSVNFNLGMDGALPLVAGICTAEQEAALLSRLLTPGRCWTPIGMTAVDQSAPYYRRDGYWNGAVWMPHQWMFWKSLLDLGRGDEAWRIASTALELWTAEVSETYNCFEHFLVETGRGAGWHCFTGLSCPVLAWFRAYFTPGSLQTGFDGLVVSRHYDGSTFKAEIRFLPRTNPTPRTVIAVVAATTCPVVSINGESFTPRVRFPGCVEITLPPDLDTISLTVSCR